MGRRERQGKENTRKPVSDEAGHKSEEEDALSGPTRTPVRKKAQRYEAALLGTRKMTSTPKRKSGLGAGHLPSFRKLDRKR